MPMDFSARQFVVPFTVFAGELSAGATETTKDEIAIFVAPFTGVVRGWQACYVNEAGTTPSIALTFERLTTVLDTLATLTTDETGARNRDLAIKIFEGETLNIKGAAANTDNAFAGLVIVLEVQPLADLV